MATVAALSRVFIWVGAIDTRLKTVESDRPEVDANVAKITAQVAILADTIHDARIHAAENFVSTGSMRRVDEKLDALGDRTGKIESGQAELGATMKAVLESIADLKRAVERR